MYLLIIQQGENLSVTSTRRIHSACGEKLHYCFSCRIVVLDPVQMLAALLGSSGLLLLIGAHRRFTSLVGGCVFSFMFHCIAYQYFVGIRELI